MIKLIAILSLISLQFVVGLGNYWFTFGLWPKSWISFFGFMACSLTLSALVSHVLKGEE
jgi:hypothetical protein